jgi:hypothetical protein
MLRTATIGLVSAIALAVSLASPAGAMGGHMGGGGRGGAGNAGGGVMHSVNAGRGGMMAVRSNSSPGRFAEHDMGRVRMGENHDRDFGRDRDLGRDRDHDRDRHDRDRFRFRFFPSFAFAVNTYSDVYDPDYGCWEPHRVLTRAGWRLRRIWVCY